ncbi:MAG: cobalamin-dependent protein [Desulfobulbaceae bacterium]|nr:cobalamin-dependent protein [Desulfobulbaceae bacterium]
MGLRCLLTSVNSVQVPFPVYPLGMAHIGGALRGQGHLVKQVDLPACGEDYLATLEANIKELQPEMIGISIRNLDLEDSSQPRSIIGEVEKIVALIRRTSKAVLVLGGPAFSLLPEKILTLLGADYGIVGEGEEAIIRLAAELEAGTPPKKQLLYSKPSDKPWQEVEYDPAITPYYISRGGMMNVQTKRGCPYQCNYCSYPLLEGRMIRKRAPEEVADEVMRLRDEFKAEYIFFTDSVFNDSSNHYLEVCEALIQRKNTLPWMAYFRPSDITEEAMSTMKRAGLDAMEIGTDAGCDASLVALGKNFTFNEAVELNNLATKHKIPCAHFFMFGGPGENSKTLQQSIENIEKLRPAVIFAFNGIRILPNTGIQQLAIEQNIIAADDDLLEPRFYFSPQITPQQIDQTLKEAWQGKPDRQYPSQEMEDRIAQFHAKGFAGPIWDKIIRMGIGR